MKTYEYKAVLSLSSNEGIGIVSIDYHINDTIKYQYFSNGRVSTARDVRIRYNNTGVPYVEIKGIRYYLSEFKRVS